MPTPNEKLIDAAKTNDFEKMIEAINEGADSNLVCDDQGNTPAHIFVSRDKVEHRPEKIEFLKTKNADFSIKNKQGDLPIHSAISTNKSASATKKLMDVMPNELLNATNAQGNTLTELLANQKYALEFFYLVNKPDFDINLKGITGQPPIALATNNNMQVPVKKLVERNAEITNYKDQADNTVLHIAAQDKVNTAVFRELLAHQEISKVINLPNEAQHSPLWVAANALNLDKVKALLEKGAVVNFQTTPQLDAAKTTPLASDKAKAAKEIRKILKEEWKAKSADAAKRMRSLSRSTPKGSGFNADNAVLNLSLPRERPAERTVIPAKSAGAASATPLSPRSTQLDGQATITVDTTSIQQTETTDAQLSSPRSMRPKSPSAKRAAIEITARTSQTLLDAIAAEEAKMKAEKEAEEKAKMEAEVEKSKQSEKTTSKYENPSFVPGGARKYNYNSPISQPASNTSATAGTAKKHPPVAAPTLIHSR